MEGVGGGLLDGSIHLPMVHHGSPKKNASELRCFEFASESDRSNINLLGGFKDFKMIKTTNQ